LLALSGVVSAQGNSDNAFERVKEVQERHTEELMAKEGVVGTAIGEGQGAQPIVLVLVEHGAVAGIPGQLEGVPVRPLVTGKIEALQKGGKPGVDLSALTPSSRWPRPVPIGVSTGHPAITAGTIGCRVKDGSGNVYALSNNHVYANQNNAVLGDAVIQPGTYDGGVSHADDIGTLSQFEIIVFSTTANNVIDAAIAQSNLGWLDSATPPDGYGKPKSTTLAAKINIPVKKYGRTTGLTKGKVYAINATVNVGYSAGNVARFVKQIVITPGTFSAGGDSGSLIVGDRQGNNTANDGKPVGLLFAGSNLYTIANPIDLVLSRFGVTVDGQ
jgi:hypothetical protein